MTLRVLFVDDEPRVLDGMRRLLRGMSGEWEMRFVDGGAAAIAALAEGEADVVVSDMRMPGMNGAELLEQVKARWPDTIRIILSGQADPGLVARTIGCAHQFLAKPCEPDLLKSTIARARRLRGLVHDAQVRRVAGAIHKLPSFPALIDELARVVADPNAPVAAAGAVVARDPGMTAKVLQVVNSAFFGLRRQIADPVEAATILGLDALRALALAARAFEAAPGPDPAMEALWRHSLAVAGLARAIAVAESAPKATCDLAFMAGMLHDVGQVILTARQPHYAHLVARTTANGIPLTQAEEALLGVDHGRIGAYLLGVWGLGDDVVAAVMFHHAPSASESAAFDGLCAVHVAVALSPDGDPAPLDAAFLARIGRQDRVDAWRGIAQRFAQVPA